MCRLLNVPVIVKSVKILVPVVLVIFRIVEIVVVPEIFKLHLPILFVAKVVNGPVTLRVPVLEPVMVPPFISKPPAPTLVIRAADQLAVPLIVNELHCAPFVFIVTVFPAQITTSSVDPGLTADAAPPQATVDQVDARLQLPDVLE